LFKSRSTLVISPIFTSNQNRNNSGGQNFHHTHACFLVMGMALWLVKVFELTVPWSRCRSCDGSTRSASCCTCTSHRGRACCRRDGTGPGKWRSGRGRRLSWSLRPGFEAENFFFVVTTAAANNALVFVASLRAGSGLSVKIFDANMAVIATLVIIPSA